MSEIITTGTAKADPESAGTRLVVPLAIGGIVVMLLAATLGLWAYLGTTVFFEMMRAGFMACFG